MFGILSYKTWLIEPGFAQRMAPILFRALEQGTLENFFQKGRESNDKILSRLYSGIEAERMYETDGPGYFVAKAKNGANVAIITMMGSITKNGEECSWGTRDYQNALAGIAKRDGISAVVIHFNNAPGGSHDGTPEMASMIKNYSKKVVAFVDGYAASAHYYIASQTSHIMMNKLTPSEVGSIGSFVIAQNVQNMVDAGQFPKIEIIRAPQSHNKALFNPFEEVTDEIRADLKAELKATVKEFIAAVKNGRGDALQDDPEMFTGLMYGTDEAIKNGLADSKGTLQDAINKAAQLAASTSTSAPARAQVNTTMSFKSKVLAAIFGKSEKAAETTEEQQASMQTADAQVAALELELQAQKDLNAAQATKVAELEAQVTELNTQVSTLNSEKEALNNEKAELQTKLDAAPTGKETTVIPSDNEASVATDPVAVKKSFRSEADEEADKYVAAAKSTISIK